MSIMISIEITLKCNSRWEIVSDEGIETCHSKYTSTFHIQPEHSNDILSGYILEVAEEAQNCGWKGKDGKIYCPECDEVDQHYSEELSSLSVSIN